MVSLLSFLFGFLFGFLFEFKTNYNSLDSRSGDYWGAGVCLKQLRHILLLFFFFFPMQMHFVLCQYMSV